MKYKNLDAQFLLYINGYRSPISSEGYKVETMNSLVQFINLLGHTSEIHIKVTSKYCLRFMCYTVSEIIDNIDEYLRSIDKLFTGKRVTKLEILNHKLDNSLPT